MKINNLLIGLGLTLTFAGCSKDLKNNPTPPKSGDTTVTTPPPPAPVPYTIMEDLEAGSKTSYAAADVNLTTGSWNFNNALVGDLAADLKDGGHAIRMKTGIITMNFDIKGVTVFSFKHGKYGNDAQSTIQVLMSADGGATYTQLGTDIVENNTTLVTDSFKVTTTTKVRFQIKSTTTNRVDVDDITFKGTGDPGLTIGTPDTGGDGDSPGSSTPSTPRDVTAGADVPPVSGDNSNLLFGNPSNATATLATMDNYLIDQKYYVESYNASKGEPNWVSWHLDNTNTTNVTDRLNNFAGWSGLPTGWYQVENTSYSGSGFDRGHNCPSADRTSSANANSATFLMTNMIPQAPQNNQQPWAKLENYLREQVVAGNEVYIIMGSYGTGGVGSNGAASTINNGHVNVPSNVWKVALIIPKGDGDVARVTASTRVIAVNTPNINTINTDWTKYITTVKSIETATGYTLLSNLPAGVRAALEVKVDNGATGS